MENLNSTELTTVVGGATKSDKFTEQLTLLQTQLKDMSCAGNKGKGNDNMMLMMAMMMMMRPQEPTVIAGGAPAACGPSSVVNISTRVRRR